MPAKDLAYLAFKTIALHSVAEFSGNSKPQSRMGQ